MGEASGTQLRIWDHALPSLVTKVGWYAELPDDTVRFVRPEHEIEDIKHALKKLPENPEYFIGMGQKGKQYLEQWHNPDIYAQAIIGFAERVCSAPSTVVAFRLAERVATETSIWISANNINHFDCSPAATAICRLLKRV